MTEIGIVGLDTSHAEAFASVLDEMADVTVSGVWDGNAVRSDEYVEAFCRDNRATRYDDVAALAESVDAAMVLTVDWESHVPLATTFLDAGLPTMVDKPIAGTVDDLSRLTAATQNAPLFGGSAVPFHRSFADFPAADAAAHCTPPGSTITSTIASISPTRFASSRGKTGRG
ncbi:Gfo/Idh/MocA family oxidoreductase [Haladaptatus sp. GCM10025893]|uniref:Gfo/Idh/MocA family oxidoreductase n=1 Tax=Haladaptatus sp. GCM10025893 TaxID=3252659 RepID=UPI003622377E